MCDDYKEEQLAYSLANVDGSDCFEFEGECSHRGYCDRCKEREMYRLRACTLSH